METRPFSPRRLGPGNEATTPLTSTSLHHTPYIYIPPPAPFQASAGKNLPPPILSAGVQSALAHSDDPDGDKYVIPLYFTPSGDKIYWVKATFPLPPPPRSNGMNESLQEEMTHVHSYEAIMEVDTPSTTSHPQNSLHAHPIPTPTIPSSTSSIP